MQTSNLFAAFTLKTERKRIYHYHLSCILTSDVSDDVAPLRFTIGRSGSIPAGRRGSLSPPNYVSANLRSDANTLVMKLKMVLSHNAHKYFND